MVIPLNELTYSREETIAAFTNFYEFLKKLYIRDCDIIYPPPEGWPSIINASPEILQAFGKSDEVISLLAHLPYIRAGGVDCDADPDVFPSRHLRDWQEKFERFAGSFSKSGKAHIDFVRDCGEGPLFPLNLPHVVSIAAGAFVPMPEIVLDTERGVICWGEETCPLRFQTDYPEYWVEREEEECACCEVLEEDEESGNEAEDDNHEQDNKDRQGGDEDEPAVDVYWGFRECGGLWRIPDFFEVLKDQFIKLHWVPFSHWCVKSARPSEVPWEKGVTAMVKGIFHENGWPDEPDRYDRDTCLNAIIRALKEKYPRSVDSRVHWLEAKQAKTSE